MAKPGKRYPPEVKQKIIAATKAARDAAKPWTDAHKAAQEAGYKGTVASLQQMMMVKKPKTKKAKPGPKPGRKRGRPAKAAPASGVDQIVTGIMRQALAAAQVELDRLKAKYGA
ncbi:MAG: hypothetical protein NTW87_11575 [Planctomycetota bacterium]|nr:hypothetical protein [Planctomycetota bacterium]